MLRRDQQKLQRIMKHVINESTNEQLAQIYDGLVKATSLGSAQGIGTDEALLSEIAAALVPEMNARKGGGQDPQLYSAA